jgi:hypothetical protein
MDCLNKPLETQYPRFSELSFCANRGKLTSRVEQRTNVLFFMADSASSVLPLAVARNLGDKVLEKRKAGALEVEIAVRDLFADNRGKVSFAQKSLFKPRTTLCAANMINKLCSHVFEFYFFILSLRLCSFFLLFFSSHFFFHFFLLLF